MIKYIQCQYGQNKIIIAKKMVSKKYAKKAKIVVDNGYV